MVSMVKGKEKIIAQGKLLELVTQEVTIEGKTKVYEFARRAPGVRMIIPSLTDTKILLSKEFRSELNRYDYRLPGGKVFDALEEYHIHMNNSKSMEHYVQQAIIREAKEEVGIKALSLNPINISRCGATIVRDLYYYEITQYEIHQQELEDGEIISYDDYDIIKQWCLDGTIDEERSATALLKYIYTIESHSKFI